MHLDGCGIGCLGRQSRERVGQAPHRARRTHLLEVIREQFYEARGIRPASGRLQLTFERHDSLDLGIREPSQAAPHLSEGCLPCRDEHVGLLVRNEVDFGQPGCDAHLPPRVLEAVPQSADVPISVHLVPEPAECAAPLERPTQSSPLRHVSHRLGEVDHVFVLLGCIGGVDLDPVVSDLVLVVVEAVADAGVHFAGYGVDVSRHVAAVHDVGDVSDVELWHLSIVAREAAVRKGCAESSGVSYVCSTLADIEKGTPMRPTSDLAVQAWLDQDDKRTADTVRAYGVCIQYVGGAQCACCAQFGEDPNDGRREERPPFAYTVGLFGVGHPELLMIGVDQQTASAVLNDVARRVRGGSDLVPGELLTFEGWTHRVMVEDVPNPGEIAFAANRFYRRPAEHSVPLLQLTYDDKHRRFPWEDGYAIPSWVQPRPGEFRA